MWTARQPLLLLSTVVIAFTWCQTASAQPDPYNPYWDDGFNLGRYKYQGEFYDKWYDPVLTEREMVAEAYELEPGDAYPPLSRYGTNVLPDTFDYPGDQYDLDRGYDDYELDDYYQRAYDYNIDPYDTSGLRTLDYAPYSLDPGAIDYDPYAYDPYDYDVSDYYTWEGYPGLTPSYNRETLDEDYWTEPNLDPNLQTPTSYYSDFYTEDWWDF